MTDEPTQGQRDGQPRASAKLGDRPSSRGPRSGRLDVGAVFDGRYEVQDLLGEGACGTVYGARRMDDGLQVALKVIHPHLAGDPQVSKRFLREAAILAQLDAPDIARIYDSGQDEHGLLYMALERVDGEPLGVIAARPTELPLRTVVHIVQSVCRALAAAHQAGVIHRDLKPDNVLVKLAGDRLESLRVLDFGLSKMLHGHIGSTNLTAQNMVLGTPEYMAPEQARGDEVDGRCDLYSVGIILYELLAGRQPFEAPTPLAVLTAQLTAPPPPLATRPSGAPIPPSLAAVVEHALAKKRADRYPDAETMSDALGSALAAPDDLVSVRPPPGPRESLPFSDTERISAGQVQVMLASRSQAVRTRRWADRIPAWLVVALSAAAFGVLVGLLVALRC